MTIIGNNVPAIGAVTGGLIVPGNLDMGGFNQTIDGLSSSTGGTVTNTPTLGVAGPGIYNASGAITVSGNSTPTISAPVALANNTAVTTTAAGDTLAIAGIVSSTGAGLNKAGAGTLTVSAANTCQGSTTVSGGTLAVTGSLSGTTAVNVSTGGTLLANSSTNSGNIFGSGNAAAGAGQKINGTVGGADFSSAGGTFAVATTPVAAPGTGGNNTAHTFNQMNVSGAGNVMDFSANAGADPTNGNVKFFFASLHATSKAALFDGTAMLTIRN